MVPGLAIQRVLHLLLPSTPFELRNWLGKEVLHMGVNDITGLYQMLTRRRHVVLVLHAGAWWGKVTDIAAQRDDAERYPSLFPSDVPRSMVRDI